MDRIIAYVFTMLALFLGFSLMLIGEIGYILCSIYMVIRETVRQLIGLIRR